MCYLVSVGYNGMAARLNRTDGDVLWNGSEGDGNVMSESEEGEGTGCEDGDGKVR
jgi:outer membrane protein assembly factor BamB